MVDLLIRNAIRDYGERLDVAITGSTITAVAPGGTIPPETATRTLDATELAVRPPFYNTHTHQAMTLFRGLGDDLPLMRWLTECVWPAEQHLTPELIYHGTRLAIVEMLHSGCVAFSDMYFYQHEIARAVQEMGVRASIGLLVMREGEKRITNDQLLAVYPSVDHHRIKLSLAPHAIYTTTPEILRDVVRRSQVENLPIQIHASESQTEVQDCLKAYGRTPIEQLHFLGLLGPTTILAHCCHATDAELDLLAQTRAIVAHCPSSNQKLASGIFPYAKAVQRGVRVTIGTDGAASNNSLSMLAETKAAALSAKLATGPDSLDVHTLYRQATTDAAEALGFEHCGELQPGAPADLILVDLTVPAFAVPSDITANLIYAADPTAIHTVICAGQILLHNHTIPGEKQIIAQAREAAAALYQA